MIKKLIRKTTEVITHNPKELIDVLDLTNQSILNGFLIDESLAQKEEKYSISILNTCFF